MKGSSASRKIGEGGYDRCGRQRLEVWRSLPYPAPPEADVALWRMGDVRKWSTVQAKQDAARPEPPDRPNGLPMLGKWYGPPPLCTLPIPEVCLVLHSTTPGLVAAVLWDRTMLASGGWRDCCLKRTLILSELGLGEAFLVSVVLPPNAWLALCCQAEAPKLRANMCWCGALCSQVPVCGVPTQDPQEGAGHRGTEEAHESREVVKITGGKTPALALQCLGCGSPPARHSGQRWVMDHTSL